MSANAINISKIFSESNVSLDEEIENGKNKHLVKCQFCPSRVLNPGLGIYSNSEVGAPKL